MRNLRHDEGNRAERGLSEMDNRFITRVTTRASLPSYAEARLASQGSSTYLRHSAASNPGYGLHGVAMSPVTSPPTVEVPSV